jgi:hypothetical protein
VDPFFYSDGSGQGSVARVNDDSKPHEPKKTSKVVLFNPKNAGKGYESAASGIGVNQPGKESAPGHSTDYVADAAKLGLALRRAIHAMTFAYLESTGI